MAWYLVKHRRQLYLYEVGLSLDSRYGESQRRWGWGEVGAPQCHREVGATRHEYDVTRCSAN